MLIASMKKIIIIFLILFIHTHIVKADDIASGYEDKSDFKNKVSEFNLWLKGNGYDQYLNFKPRQICKDEAKAKKDGVWYINKCNEFTGSNNLKIKFYKNRWQVHPHAEPNRDTLIYYLWKTINHPYTGSFHQYKIEPSKDSHEFKSNLRNDESVKKELKESAILSYLLFEDDKIVIDEKSPK